MSVSRYLPRVRLLLLWGLELLLCCCHGLAAEASPSSGGGVIYPPLTEDIDGMAETPLFVGLIESYDPAHPDQLLRSVGTIVGTEMALDHINANPSILPGYRLYYNFINSQCNPQQAADATLRQVLNKPTKIGIIGAGCSPSTQNSALISQFYNLTQISCISASPLLANREVYRQYFQMIPPELGQVIGFYNIITHYGWTRVGVIVEDEDLFTETFFDLRDKLRSVDVEVHSVKLHHNELETDRQKVFDYINFEGLRIFLILSYESFAMPFLCEAYKRGMWYPEYLFMLNGWYRDRWWMVEDHQFLDCSPEQIEQTNSEFFEAQKRHINNPSPPLNLTKTDHLSQYCYDATWAFALVLNKTISDFKANKELSHMAAVFSNSPNEIFSIEDFEYGNSVVLNQMMINWNNISFIGLTGHVSFSSGLRESHYIQITQYLEDDYGNFSEKEVGYLELTHNFSLTPIVTNISWKYGEPHDGSIGRVTDTLSKAVTTVVFILGITGIIFAAICILLNILFRKKPVIKLSSPNLNYMIGSGAILLYISIILVAIPLPNANMATSLCLVTPWFTAIGFSLCYGTILAKMLRIWYIFHNPVVKKKQVHDWMLVLLVMCLVVSDVVILAVYTGLEASQGAASLVPNRENEITISRPQKVMTEHFVYVCNSTERKITLGILYGFETALQVLALLLSFATWKVHIPGLDDSKPIIAATYVTSLVLAVVMVSTYSLVEYINVYATVFGLGFFVGTTLILCLVFMTKIYMLVQDPEGKAIFRTNPGGDIQSGSSYPASKAKETLPPNTANGHQHTRD